MGKEQADELSSLQIQLASLKESLAKEREQRQSMQQQMLCLEQELDAKEATINELERDLERKDDELSKFRRFGTKPVGSDDARFDEDRIRSLEHQLRDRERQLEAKDGHIVRLLSVPRQHPSRVCSVKNIDEESTACT